MIVGITGGNGFIGRALALRHLEEGDTVRILLRRSRNDRSLAKGIKCFYADISEPTDTMMNFVEGVDVLYHCAGEIRDTTKMYATHVTGVRRLCDAAAHNIGHWVQLSSVGAYGPQSDGIVTEKTAMNPVGIYEITKAVSEQIVADASSKKSFTYSVLRPSNVFGADMTNQSLFQMIDMINKRFFFFIGQPGSSANYIHVDNVVEGLWRCGTMPGAKGLTYNLSDHRTMEEFVAIIATALGKPLPVLRLSKKCVQWITKYCQIIPRFPLTESRIDGLTSRVRYSIEKIQHDIGYSHVVSMDDGLYQLVKTWKHNKQNMRKEKNGIDD